jgi:hypothetical protein
MGGYWVLGYWILDIQVGGYSSNIEQMNKELGIKKENNRYQL